MVPVTLLLLLLLLLLLAAAVLLLSLHPYHYKKKSCYSEKILYHGGHGGHGGYSGFDSEGAPLQNLALAPVSSKKQRSRAMENVEQRPMRDCKTTISLRALRVLRGNSPLLGRLRLRRSGSSVVPPI